MTFSTTPTVGATIGQVNVTFPHRLGTVLKSNDGHDYILAKATGAIAVDAVTVLTEPAMTMATGAGAWTNKNTVALVLNDVAWFKKTAI